MCGSTAQFDPFGAAGDAKVHRLPAPAVDAVMLRDGVRTKVLCQRVVCPVDDRIDVTDRPVILHGAPDRGSGPDGLLQAPELAVAEGPPRLAGVAQLSQNLEIPQRGRPQTGAQSS